MSEVPPEPGPRRRFKTVKAAIAALKPGLPLDCLPRRSPDGGFEPITLYARVDEDGNYIPKWFPVPAGGPFKCIWDLEAALRARYTAVYQSCLNRRKRPLDPPPTFEPFDFFECVIEEVAPQKPPKRERPQDHVSPSEEPLNNATAVLEGSSASTAAVLPLHRPPLSSYRQHAAVAQEDAAANKAVVPPSGSRIWETRRPEWGLTFYIRVDPGGSLFHTYPHAGGPFQSFEEADAAIDRYLDERRDPKMCMDQDGVRSLEKMIQKSLYWPDVTRKKHSKSQVTEQVRIRMSRLCQALVDKYNEDHDLLGDLAYELKDFVEYEPISEKRVLYYHLNVTMTKGGTSNLFFAELKYMRQGKKEELVVNCFCMVKPTDNGHCYGCTNNGSVDMKHPNSADEYSGGHLDIHVPFVRYVECSDSDDDVEVRKAELRHMYKGLDDPRVVARLFTLPPNVTRVD